MNPERFPLFWCPYNAEAWNHVPWSIRNAISNGYRNHGNGFIGMQLSLFPIWRPTDHSHSALPHCKDREAVRPLFYLKFPIQPQIHHYHSWNNTTVFAYGLSRMTMSKGYTMCDDGLVSRTHANNPSLPGGKWTLKYIYIFSYHIIKCCYINLGNYDNRHAAEVTSFLWAWCSIHFS